MTTISVQAPRTVATPRGAILGAWVFRQVSIALGTLQARRSERLARQQLAARIADAAGVRRYAQSMMKVDVRFAADLFAAADRHEEPGK
jgi:hypothetical protein